MAYLCRGAPLQFCDDYSNLVLEAYPPEKKLIQFLKQNRQFVKESLQKIEDIPLFVKFQ